MAMTDELKEQLKEDYLGSDPTSETSVEIVKEIAERYNLTANAVRMYLVQEKVYIAKSKAVAAAKKTASGEAPKRVSKEESIAALKEAIEAAGKTVDEEILSKLTGKAAVYFTSLFN